jgi:hypothetical protein
MLVNSSYILAMIKLPTALLYMACQRKALRERRIDIRLLVPERRIGEIRSVQNVQQCRVRSNRLDELTDAASRRRKRVLLEESNNLVSLGPGGEATEDVADASINQGWVGLLQLVLDVLQILQEPVKKFTSIIAHFKQNLPL